MTDVFSIRFSCKIEAAVVHLRRREYGTLEIN